jgi:hypothetical protein
MLYSPALPETMPETTRTPAMSDPGGSDMTRTYVLVLVVETLVVFALWAFSRYFS